MTFLESLWIALYVAENQRRYAAYASMGLVVGAGLTQDLIDALVAQSQAYASAMITATLPASTAGLEAAIDAMKAP